MTASDQSGISVALCTFNGALYLRRQLESIARQERKPSEVIVCDDGSTDATLAIAEECLVDAGVPYRIERNPIRLGSSANFGRAFGLCTHELIVPCDQDDRWHPNKLRVVAETFERNPRLGMVFSNATMIDEDDQPLGYTQWESAMFGRAEQELARRGELLSVLLRYPVVCGATMAFRRTLLPLVLPVAEEWVHDEWISWLCAATSEVAFVEEALIDYRRHSTQQIGAARLTLSRQLATARRLNLAYFEKQVRRLERLQERLTKWRSEPEAQWQGHPGPDRFEAIEGKLAYQRELVRIRRFPPHRWWASTQALLNGDHRRFGLGVKSWLVDLAHPWVSGD